MMTSRYAVVENGVVTNVVMWDGQNEWVGSGTAVAIPDDSPVSMGYAYDGTTFTAPVVIPPTPTPAELQAALTVAVQAILDAKAQSYGYDSIQTAVTYADEPAVPKFQAEGQALRAWRSDVWAAAYAYLALVQAGTKTYPTMDEIPALLPTYTPPVES